jgi:diguanylate cyclase
MKNTQITDQIPFTNFEDASKAILAYLHKRLGFGLWMMTRTEGPDWIILQTEDHGYNVKEGSVFRWADSFCSQMVVGFGPRVAPCSQDIPAYESAPIAKQVPINAYIGVPVTKEDGSLFGTLCAIDPEPQNDTIREELPLIELFAKLLGTILTADLKTVEQERLIERSQQEAQTDELTGLLNRRGWEQSIALEEARARRYGNPTCVIITDLDALKYVNDTEGHSAGDALIKNAAMCLKNAARENDIVARLGGDEFGILAVECDTAGSEALQKKVLDTLKSNSISASVGKAMRNPERGLEMAVAAADEAMYAVKTERRKSRPRGRV